MLESSAQVHQKQGANRALYRAHAFQSARNKNNTNLIEDVDPLTFSQVSSNSVQVAEKKSKMPQPIRGRGGHCCFPTDQKKIKININLVEPEDFQVLASCQVSSNSVQ